MKTKTMTTKRKTIGRYLVLLQSLSGYVNISKAGLLELLKAHRVSNSLSRQLIDLHYISVVSPDGYQVTIAEPTLTHARFLAEASYHAKYKKSRPTERPLFKYPTLESLANELIDVRTLLHKHEERLGTIELKWILATKKKQKLTIGAAVIAGWNKIIQSLTINPKKNGHKKSM